MPSRRARSLVATTAFAFFVASGCAGGGGDDTPTAPDVGAESIDAGGDDADALFPVDDGATIDSASGDDTFDAAPIDCNAMPVTAWTTPVPSTDLVGVAGTPALDPYVLPDGLTILFSAANASGKSRIHVATRASRTDPFSGVALLDGFDDATFGTVDVEQPAAVGLEEIVFAAPPGVEDLWVATRAAASGPVTTRHYTEAFLDTSGIEASPTLSADGARMIFSRGGASGGSYSLYEATRLTTSPGSDWVGVSALSSLNDPAYSVACPALSPDGLTLFYASDATAPGTTSTTVFVAQRTSVTTAFGSGTPVAALTAAGKFNCPRSITADGCELYLTTDADGAFSAHVARRTSH